MGTSEYKSTNIAIPRPPKPPAPKRSPSHSFMGPTSYTIQDLTKPKTHRFNKKKIVKLPRDHNKFVHIRTTKLPSLEREAESELKSNAISSSSTDNFSPSDSPQEYAQINGTNQSKKRQRASNNCSNSMSNPPKKKRKISNNASSNNAETDEGNVWDILLRSVHEVRTKQEERHKAEIEKIIKAHNNKQNANEQVQKELKLLKSDNIKLRAGITKSVQLVDNFKAQMIQKDAENNKLTKELEQCKNAIKDLNESLVAGHGIIKDLNGKHKEKENEWNKKKEKYEQTIDSILTEKETQTNVWKREREKYQQKIQELKNQKGFDEIWEEHRNNVKDVNGLNIESETKEMVQLRQELKRKFIEIDAADSNKKMNIEKILKLEHEKNALFESTQIKMNELQKNVNSQNDKINELNQKLSEYETKRAQFLEIAEDDVNNDAINESMFDDVDRVSMDVIDESNDNAENIDSDAIEEELDAMHRKKEKYEEKICELKKKLRAKKEERNKYKTKAEDLQAQIDRLKAVDWEGDIVKEYKD